MLAIEAGQKGAYYLIDRKRRLCFFQHKDALTKVECSAIPEAASLMEGDLGTPTAARSDGVNPLKHTRATEPETPVAGPTPEEVSAFKAAYGEILCQSRQRAAFSPAKPITANSLTLKRYSQIEGHLAKNSRLWSKLVREAARACQPQPGANKEAPIPPDETEEPPQDAPSRMDRFGPEDGP
jgi:hypothetical protein